MTNTYLFGASGHGKVIKDILNANGVNVEAFVDDNPEVNECAGRPVLHDAAGLSPIIVSIGVNRVRKFVVERLIAESEKMKAESESNVYLGSTFPTLSFSIAIHPSAIVSPSAKIGEGTVVMAGAVINADAVIGRHCIINSGASVDHECVIGDYCHIAPHATLCGQVHVGEGTLVGVGSCVIPCINIGNWCTIGAGAAVTKDIENNKKAVGIPAKPLNTVI